MSTADGYVLIEGTPWDNWADELEALTFLTQFNIEPDDEMVFRVPESRTPSWLEAKALDWLAAEHGYTVERT